MNFAYINLFTEGNTSSKHTNFYCSNELLCFCWNKLYLYESVWNSVIIIGYKDNEEIMVDNYTANSSQPIITSHDESND